MRKASFIKADCHYIYVASVAGLKSVYKVGQSIDPVTRMSTLKCTTKKEHSIVMLARCEESSLLSTEKESHMMLYRHRYKRPINGKNHKEYFRVDLRRLINIVMTSAYYECVGAYNRDLSAGRIAVFRKPIINILKEIE